ncbi:hypothetical protein E2C01_096167 [Portunus trituberculatus]|uniref:DDE-1 domain-containing protein n=1 Tax=Portunus trituberculatus TaxID=210409 RepID=A0A5B7K676_PORTR|nr:hypothetical protein [Portunus trituberculatus]
MYVEEKEARLTNKYYYTKWAKLAQAMGRVGYKKWADLAQAKGRIVIIIIRLPPHTTDVLQPLNVCYFKPLKTRWDATIAKWQAANYA